MRIETDTKIIAFNLKRCIAFETKHVGATDTKQSRIKVAYGGRTMFLSWDCALGPIENSIEAVKAFVRKYYSDTSRAELIFRSICERDKGYVISCEFQTHDFQT